MAFLPLRAPTGARAPPAFFCLYLVWRLTLRLTPIFLEDAAEGSNGRGDVVALDV